ncbi:CipC1 protein, partial [Melanogaster broomeanus]
QHEGSFTHDALAAGVAYEAAKAYEDHLAANGKPDSHAKAKEILAGLAGAALTQLVETKGEDAWDAHKRKQAEEQGELYFY